MITQQVSTKSNIEKCLTTAFSFSFLSNWYLIIGILPMTFLNRELVSHFMFTAYWIKNQSTLPLFPLVLCKAMNKFANLYAKCLRNQPNNKKKQKQNFTFQIS